MREKTFKLLNVWSEKHLNEIKHSEIFVFGSLIYLDGVSFRKETSDLDLLIVLDDSYLDDILSRTQCLINLKRAKKELEKEILILWERENAKEQIVSILPIFASEIWMDIHKSGVSDFYQNEFANVRTNKIEPLVDSFVKPDIKYTVPTLGIQILQEVQHIRNSYLKNSATSNIQELAYNGRDTIPKKLSRSFAKLNALQHDLPFRGDEFNTSLGLDLLKSMLNSRRHEPNFYKLYTWIDHRSGGRSNTTNPNDLEENQHLLAYELLWELTIEIKKKENEILAISDGFIAFLESVDILSKAHSKEQTLELDDIYVEPTFKKYQETNNNNDLSLESILQSIMNEELVVITGESQSGKTTVCKKIFTSLYDKGYIPIYMSDENNRYSGNLLNRANKSLSFQYNSPNITIKNISIDKIVVIFDNFHLANKSKRLLDKANYFTKIIITGDDIFGIGLSKSNIIVDYTQYKINEFTPSRRSKLIENWVRIGVDPWTTENEILKEIDEKGQLVNQALGRLIGKGIMPSYPFYIYSFISNYEVGNRPLDQNISSYGYFYQSLIYTYLRKVGVKNEVIDMYLNYLTELSFYLFINGNKVLEEDKYRVFIDSYRESYIITDSNKEVHIKLLEAGILTTSDTGGFSFKYPYLYYFFCGKYLADNIIDQKDHIEYIMHNLHVDDFSYIAIFISHHEKNTTVLQDLALNAMYLFDHHEPASLSKTELEFFDSKIEEVIQATLPIATLSIQDTRSEILKKEDANEIQSRNYENLNQNGDDFNDEDEETSYLMKELRRSIRTVEVIGQIIKNRAGSLKSSDIEALFAEGLKVHLRIISSYFALIKDEKAQDGIVELLAHKISDSIQEESQHKQEKLLQNKDAFQKIAKKMFWNMNFSLVYGLMTKIISSLGSNLLLSSINKGNL